MIEHSSHFLAALQSCCALPSPISMSDMQNSAVIGKRESFRELLTAFNLWPLLAVKAGAVSNHVKVLVFLEPYILTG